MKPRQRYFRPPRHSSFQRGFVIAVNAQNGTAQVRFPQQGNLVSGWLTVLARKTLDDKDWWLPDLGELVSCLVDENFEDGAVLGSSYSAAASPPAGATANQWIKEFSDGTILTYDRSAHTLTATLCNGGSAKITCPNGITVNQMAVDSSGNIATPGNITANGTITGKTDVLAGPNNISGAGHVHTDVETGSAVSGPPQT